MQSRFHYTLRGGDVIMYKKKSDATAIEKTVGMNRFSTDVTQEKDKLLFHFWGIIADGDPYRGSSDTINSNDISSVAGAEWYMEFESGDPTLGHVKQYIVLPFALWEIGVTTIPFKYRFGYTKGDVIVQNEASASINAGIYVGRKWGTTRFYADKTNHNAWVFTLAAYTSPLIITLKKNNENSFDTNYTYDRNELGISVGAAGMLSYRDISLGLFTGIDFPISGKSPQWFYSYKPWIGFGVGYKLNALGVK